VDFWQGSYQRSALMRETYQWQSWDGCTGQLSLGEITQRDEERQESFTVDNPNLHDDVAASFALVPMTDSEARAAFALAKDQCERWLPR
jgi:hypothetical protein